MAEEVSEKQIASLKILLLERQAQLKALDEEGASWRNTVSWTIKV